MLLWPAAAELRRNLQLPPKERRVGAAGGEGGEFATKRKEPWGPLEDITGPSKAEFFKMI